MGDFSIFMNTDSLGNEKADVFGVFLVKQIGLN